LHYFLYFLHFLSHSTSWPLNLLKRLFSSFFRIFWTLTFDLLKRLFSSFFRHKRNKRMGRDGRVG
jgi:hypothetical protein